MNIWKVSHGQSCFKPNKLKALEDECMVCVDKNTLAKGVSRITQGQAFVNEVKEGDLFYLCIGNQSVELFGMFTNEINIKDDGWAYRKYKLLFKSIKKDTQYKGEKHWWTPNDNSTFIKVKDSEHKRFEDLILQPYFGKTFRDLEEILKEKNVELYTMTLADVLKLKLNIPTYQRIYCWTEKNVIQLLHDCQTLNKEYRLGSIILQNNKGKYDIIDGQQRLVTLTLLLKELGDERSPLLSCSYTNAEAIAYLKYNKWVIRNIISKKAKPFNVDDMMKRLTFNVLILDNSSRELAYTFFSNENSRGKALSDYDLLKAHHLRYVYEEPQAKHLSQRWDHLLLEGNKQDCYDERDYVRTLSIYLFRLRKWLGYEDWDEQERHKIKTEFEAAPYVAEIPSFGEKFEYKEPIQGGPHFFAYVERFVERFHSFTQTNQYKALHVWLAGETHCWLRDVIEAIMFAYYLKFGNAYINDALVLVTRIISQVRYDIGRIHQSAIFDHVKTTKLAMLIDRSSSPTFCLQSMLCMIETMMDFEGEFDKDGKQVKRIRSRYCGCLHSLFEELKQKKENYTINDIDNILETWKKY